MLLLWSKGWCHVFSAKVWEVIQHVLIFRHHQESVTTPLMLLHVFPLKVERVILNIILHVLQLFVVCNRPECKFLVKDVFADGHCSFRALASESEHNEWKIHKIWCIHRHFLKSSLTVGLNQQQTLTGSHAVEILSILIAVILFLVTK
jgi:hypothetical protein